MPVIASAATRPSRDPLDTHALIDLPRWAKDGHPVIKRVAAGESAAVCGVVWYEFLCGPLAEGEAELAHAFLQGRIRSVTEEDARLAAELFHATGRKRVHLINTLIAACAIRANAEFLTINTADFQPLAAHGLRRVSA